MFIRQWLAFILCALALATSSALAAPGLVPTQADPPDNPLYLPVMLNPLLAATGRVTLNGKPAAGTVISMDKTDNNWSTYATVATVTDANGVYNFKANTPAALSQTIAYQVYYSNPSASTAANGRLLTWVCDVRGLNSGSDACDMNIADIVVSGPAAGAALKPPVTFRWTLRATTTDSYRLYFADYYSPLTTFCYTNLLGYHGGYTLNSLSALPNCSGTAHLLSGEPYWWYLTVYGPGGYGIAYLSYLIQITGAASPPLKVSPVRPTRRTLQTANRYQLISIFVK